MSFGVSRGKKFQPRIPREQLLEMTTQELQAKGVEHNSQSRLMLEIANEIYSNDEPIFAQLRGHAFVRDAEAWSRAYSLVKNYLRENEMKNSLEAIDIELANSRAIKHNKSVDSPDAFSKILSKINKKKRPFKDRVKEWKEEDEKLNPKPAFVRPTLRDMKKGVTQAPATQKTPILPKKKEEPKQIITQPVKEEKRPPSPIRDSPIPVSAAQQQKQLPKQFAKSPLPQKPANQANKKNLLGGCQKDA